MREFPRPHTPETGEIKIKAAKIHLLIHPDFLTYPSRHLPSPEQAEKFQALLDSYIGKAETLKDKPEELMFAFVARTPEEMKADIGSHQPYTETLFKIKNFLSDRLIVLTDDHEEKAKGSKHGQNITRWGHKTDEEKTQFQAGINRIFNDMKRLASARGFELDKNVESEAYGELINQCLTSGAMNINKAGQFATKTIIKEQLTDLGIGDQRSVKPEYYQNKKKDIVKNPGAYPEAPYVDLGP